MKEKLISFIEKNVTDEKRLFCHEELVDTGERGVKTYLAPKEKVIEAIEGLDDNLVGKLPNDENTIKILDYEIREMGT